MPSSRTSPTPAIEPTRGPGRPRSETAHLAILAAAIEIVREVGYDASTMDAIAERAGVGKATLYRRWTSKEPLIAEALEGIARSIDVPDTGSTRGDVIKVLSHSLRMYHDPASRGLLSGLVAAMARSPMIAEAVRSGFLAARTETMRRVLLRGIERGDVRKDIDVETVIDVLRGPLLMRGLLTGERLDEPLVARIVDLVMRGVAPGASRPTRQRAR